MKDDEIDAQSPTWRAVLRFARERRAQHQAYIESPGLAALETELSRGALRELTLLIDLANNSQKTTEQVIEP